MKKICYGECMPSFEELDWDNQFKEPCDYCKMIEKKRWSYWNESLNYEKAMSFICDIPEPEEDNLLLLDMENK